MNTENSKTYESNTLTDKLNLKNPSKKLHWLSINYLLPMENH